MGWTVVLAWVLGAVIAGVGAYVGAYLRQKGQNFARREDLESLVQEVKRVTQTAEDIKQEVSHGYWERQRQWEIKRDVLNQVAKSVKSLNVTLMGLAAVSSYFHMETLSLERQLASEKAGAWGEAFDEFDRVATLVAVSCEGPTINACNALYVYAQQIARRLTAGDEKAYEEQYHEFARLRWAITHAFRKELGIGETARAASP